MFPAITESVFLIFFGKLLSAAFVSYLLSEEMFKAFVRYAHIFDYEQEQKRYVEVLESFTESKFSKLIWSIFVIVILMQSWAFSAIAIGAIAIGWGKSAGLAGDYARKEPVAFVLCGILAAASVFLTGVRSGETNIAQAVIVFAIFIIYAKSYTDKRAEYGELDVKEEDKKPYTGFAQTHVKTPETK